jgi:hypothetical protein
MSTAPGAEVGTARCIVTHANEQGVPFPSDLQCKRAGSCFPGKNCQALSLARSASRPSAMQARKIYASATMFEPGCMSCSAVSGCSGAPPRTPAFVALGPPAGVQWRRWSRSEPFCRWRQSVKCRGCGGWPPRCRQPTVARSARSAKSQPLAASVWLRPKAALSLSASEKSAQSADGAGRARRLYARGLLKAQIALSLCNAKLSPPRTQTRARIQTRCLADDRCSHVQTPVASSRRRG